MKYFFKKFGKEKHNNIISVLHTDKSDVFFSRKVEEYRRIGISNKNQISFII